jgi:hypothetical protein
MPDFKEALKIWAKGILYTQSINQSINQSIYFIFHKSITRHTPYGYRNGQKNIYIQILEVIYTTSNATLYTKEQLIK